MIARERGLEPLAEMILNDTGDSGDLIRDQAKEFVTEEVPHRGRYSRHRYRSGNYY